MRPLATDKGGQPGTYPYNLATDYTLQTFTFAQGNAPSAVALFNTTSPTRQQCFDTATYIAQVRNKQAKRKADHDDQAVIAKATQAQATKLYGTALGALCSAIGRFCSYCEQPLTEKAQVEHICAKAEYPEFIMAWENFLVACPFCNEAKSDDPMRAAAFAFLNNANPTEMDYYDGIKDYYLWPQYYVEGYRNMPAQLEYKDGLGQWQPLDLKTLATKAGQSWDSTNNDTGEVKANVWLKSTDVATTLATVKVTVITKDIKSQALTNLFKLNIKTQTQDLRTARRTEAWFAALERVETLNACGANQAKFDKEWRTTLFLAKTLGFYSVWVLVFRATKAKDPTNASLATKFVTDTNVANYFPNTDTTEVP